MASKNWNLRIFLDEQQDTPPVAKAKKQRGRSVRKPSRLRNSKLTIFMDEDTSNIPNGNKQ